jgi:hypothetical protein
MCGPKHHPGAFMVRKPEPAMAPKPRRDHLSPDSSTSLPGKERGPFPKVISDHTLLHQSVYPKKTRAAVS